MDQGSRDPGPFFVTFDLVALITASDCTKGKHGISESTALRPARRIVSDNGSSRCRW